MFNINRLILVSFVFLAVISHSAPANDRGPWVVRQVVREGERLPAKTSNDTTLKGFAYGSGIAVSGFIGLTIAATSELKRLNALPDSEFAGELGRSMLQSVIVSPYASAITVVGGLLAPGLILTGYKHASAILAHAHELCQDRGFESYARSEIINALIGYNKVKWEGDPVLYFQTLWCAGWTENVNAASLLRLKNEDPDFSSHLGQYVVGYPGRSADLGTLLSRFVARKIVLEQRQMEGKKTETENVFRPVKRQREEADLSSDHEGDLQEN